MIPILEPNIDDDELQNITDAVKSGWVSSQGDFVEEFENNFANYHHVSHGISTSNGTTALHLALAALGIRKNDEVIVPSLTFIATVNSVIYCNATPIFAESDPQYWCMDPEDMEKRITKNTKAIIPVHLYGHPCDMDWIIDIAEDYDLFVIEDAAQAHGAKYKGKKVGTFGDISCFSFFANKIITTGEGGMCITDNLEFAEKMKLLRDHGMNPEKRYWHDQIGFNYRMTNMQAAIGVAQLKKLDNFIEKKIKIANTYNDGFKEFQAYGEVVLHPEMDWAKCNYWLYSILIEDNFKVDRNSLMVYLEGNGIETRSFFYPAHIMPPYKNGETLKVSEELSRKGVNLPSSTNLNLDDVKKVINCINEL